MRVEEAFDDVEAGYGRLVIGQIGAYGLCGLFGRAVRGFEKGEYYYGEVALELFPGFLGCAEGFIYVGIVECLYGLCGGRCYELFYFHL